jgi:hypothetical protein
VFQDAEMCRLFTHVLCDKSFVSSFPPRAYTDHKCKIEDCGGAEPERPLVEQIGISFQHMDVIEYVFWSEFGPRFSSR